MPANCIFKFISMAYVFGQVVIGCKSAYETIIDQPTLVLNVTINCLEI